MMMEVERDMPLRQCTRQAWPVVVVVVVCVCVLQESENGGIYREIF